MQKYLIFGSSGFIGKNFCEIAKSKKIEAKIIESDSTIKKGKYRHKCDLSSYRSVRSLIKKISPDLIINFAGTFTNQLHIDLISNCVSSVNIIQSLLDLKFRKTKLILIGSSSELIFEKKELKKNKLYSDYALSKFFQRLVFDKYKNEIKLNLIYCRIFNPYGFGISHNLMVGNLYKQIDLFKKGVIKKIRLGNLNSSRDYIQINQLIEQIFKVIQIGKSSNIYDLGMGKLTKTKDIVHKILSENNLNLGHIYIDKKLQIIDKGPVAKKIPLKNK